MVKKIVADITDSLRGHPVAISLLSLNILFLGASAWTTHEIANNSRIREAAFHALIRDCMKDANR